MPCHLTSRLHTSHDSDASPPFDTDARATRQTWYNIHSWSLMLAIPVLALVRAGARAASTPSPPLPSELRSWSRHSQPQATRPRTTPVKKKCRHGGILGACWRRGSYEVAPQSALLSACRAGRWETPAPWSRAFHEQRATLRLVPKSKVHVAKPPLHPKDSPRYPLSE